MNKEKIQHIFIYSVIFLIIAGIIALGVYFFLDYQKWQGYRGDPNKKVFVEKIEELKKKSSRDQIYYLELGNEYLNLGEIELAVENYEKSVEIKRFDTNLINLGNAYFSNKEYKKAEGIYLEIIEKYPIKVEVYSQLLELYKIDWEGRKYSPEYAIDAGLANNPDNFNLLVLGGEYYRSIGDKTKALDYYNKALAIDPNGPNSESLKQDIESLNR